MVILSKSLHDGFQIKLFFVKLLNLFVDPHNPKYVETKMQSFSDLFLDQIASSQLCADNSLMASSQG